ncbi:MULTISPECIES: SRPBCC family protein [unclassified Nocardia]|uniref:SRPBCC family protein n=1 Tax=unclassified Nocardia TaxID=2637762 RepID=UPI0024A843D4|nr:MULTISPECIES: SRPBCC family protein [unclassified Nocardia]
MSLGYVPVTVESTCRTSAATAMEVIAPIDLPTIFTGMGPLPAVREVRDQSGPWDTAGNTRTVVLSDGSTAREELTGYTRARHFSYELTEFTGTMRRLVAKVDGEWTFTPAGRNSLVRWTYSFFPHPGRARLVRYVVAPLWRRYATATLARAIREAEQATV